MGQVLAECVGAVVAAYAIARYVDVIKIRGHPGDSYVAVVASIAARDMCRRLAGCDVAVVAGITSTNYLRVVHHGRRSPKIDAVTIFADRCCRNMRSVLASCIGTVVAARTIADYVCVIEIRRCPGDGCVAIVAVVAAGQMCRVFAGCSYAVMAGAATAQHLSMINAIGWRKRNRVMAVLADIG